MNNPNPDLSICPASPATIDPIPYRAYWFRVGIWFLVLWTLTISVWLYVFSVREGGVPCWDEFERCAWASHIWYGIRHFDLFHLWKYTNNQVVWPPLHSWMTGMLFTLFGPSLATARLLSLAAFWGTGVLILLWFVRQGGRFSWVGGMTAWCLYSTAPIMIQQAVGVMSEGVGLFITMLILVLLPRQDNETVDDSPQRWVWCGILLGLFFLYKYNYAFLTYAGLGVSRYFQAGASLRRMMNKKNAWLFGLPVIIMVLWFIPSHENKWNNLIYFVLNNPSARQPWGFSTLFYYPQVIPQSYFVLPWLSVVCLAFFFIAIPLSWRGSLRNPVLACCLIQFIAVAIHPMKMDRFQFITMGLFFILAGEALQTLLVYLDPKKRSWEITIILVLVGFVLFPTVVYQADHFQRAQLYQENIYTAPILSVVDRMQPADRTALFITDENACPPAATFYMMTLKDLLQHDLRTNVSHWHHLFLMQDRDAVLALSPEDRMRHLQHELYITDSNKIAVIETTAPDQVSIFPRVFAGVQEYIRMIPALSDYEKVFEKEFPRSRMRVRIFAMKKP